MRRALPTLLLFATACALGLPTLFTPVGLDQGILAYVGADILDGGVPYLTTWDHKPPGSHLLYALTFGLLGRSEEAIRILDLVYVFLIALLTGRITARLLGGRAAGARAGLWAGLILLLTYYTRLSWWDMAQPDGYMTLPMLGCLQLALLDVARRRGGYALAAGLALGLAFCFKFVALAVLLPVLWVYLGAWRADRDSRRLGGSLLLIGGGFVAVNAALLLYLWAAGALDNYLEIHAVFNRGYVLSALRGEPVQLVLRLAGWGVYGLALLALVALVRLLAPRLLPTGAEGSIDAEGELLEVRNGRTLIVLLLALAAEIAVQAKFYHYHFIPLLVPLSALAAVGLDWGYRRLGLHRGQGLGRRVAAAAVVCAALVGVLLPGHRRLLGRYAEARAVLGGERAMADHLVSFGGYGDGGGFSSRACREAADYLRRRTRPADPIYVWGFDPLLPFLAGRSQPTRFTYNTPLVVPWREEAWRRELMVELRARPPLYIVALRNDQHPWTTGRSDDSWAILQRDFVELKRLIAAGYALEATLEDYRIFRRRPAPGPR